MEQTVGIPDGGRAVVEYVASFDVKGDVLMVVVQIFI